MSEFFTYALWPFQFPFMTNAMLIAVMVAIPTALLSCFLVLRGWALMGDAISHAVLPGIVLAYLAGLPIALGAFLVVAMIITPGATAYLLTDRFPRLIVLSVLIGAGTSFVGAYISYFLDGATGGVIVLLQTLIFLLAFLLAPKHGMLAARRRAAAALETSR